MEGSEETKFKIVVNLYDLTGGMAKVFSPMFLGKQIEGIWHTGLCIYNKEYYFGGGICSSAIKQTPYGTPIREIEIGVTELPEDVFQGFLEDIQPKYTIDKYDLINNNCNNFTDDCVHFLCGEHLPEYITGLPAECLNTPIGQMLKPVIDQMQNQVLQQSGQTNMFPQAFEGQSNNNQQVFQNNNTSSNNQQQQQTQSQQQQPPPNPADLMNLIGNLNFNNNQAGAQNNNNNNSTQQQDSQIDMKKVKEITDFMDFIDLTSTSKACVIDFYSQTCPPCKIIKPVYAAMSEQYPEINFFMVDGQKQQDIASQFQLQGYPTFITYYKGEFESKWVGANQIKLTDNLKKLQEKLNAEKTESENK